MSKQDGKKVDAQLIQAELQALAQKGESVRSVQTFRGPLPPQVLNKLDKETANQLVEHFIEHVNRQDQLNEMVVQSAFADKQSERFHGTIKTIIGAIITVSIFVVSIFTNNIQFLKDLIPLVTAVLGGAGIGIYYFVRRSKKEKLPVAEIEE